MGKSKASQPTKAKRIQHHETTSATNAKGTSLGEKHKRRRQKRKGRIKTHKTDPK